MRLRLRRAVVVLVPVSLAVAGVVNALPATNLADPAPAHARALHSQWGDDLLDISLAHESGSARGRYAPYLLLGDVFDEPTIVSRPDHAFDAGLVLGLSRGDLVVEEYDDLLTEGEASRLRGLPHFEGTREDGRRYVVVEPGAGDGKFSTVRVMTYDDTLFVALESTFDRSGDD